MSYADRIKAKIKEADVEKQLTELVDEGEKLLREAVSTAGEVAHNRRTEVQTWLDKASEKVNEKTEGKYADQLAKVSSLLLSGVDKVAEQRSSSDAADAADGTDEDTPPVPLAAAEPGDPEPPAASTTEPSVDAPPTPEG